MHEVSKRAVHQILNVFKFQSAIYFPFNEKKLQKDPHQASNFIPDQLDWSAADLAYLHKRETGKFTSSAPDAEARYFPLFHENNVFCVIGIKIENMDSESQELEFLKKFVNEISYFMLICLKEKSM